jgi:transcriptional regulator with XRE-family HTH domain
MAKIFRQQFRDRNIAQLVLVREAKHFTQEDIAKRMGTTQANVSKWEKNPSSLTLGQLKRLANVLGCSIEDLIEEDTSDRELFQGLDFGEPYTDLERRLDLLNQYIADQVPTESQSIELPDITLFKRTVRRFARKPAIAVVGPFDAGKSTFLNTILGRESLPEDYTPTTRLVTRILHINEKPKWLHNSENVVILRKNEEFDDLDPQSDNRPSSVVTVGTYALLQSFGTVKGEHSGDPDAEQIVVFLDAPILRSCNLIDFPGFGHQSQDEATVKSLLQRADIVLYLSPSIGFMPQQDLARLGPIIQTLPPFEQYEDRLPALGTLFIVASHAYRHIPDEKLDEILEQAAQRIDIGLGDTRLDERARLVGKRITAHDVTSRLFYFLREDPERRRHIFEDLYRLCSDYLVSAWMRVIDEQITKFKMAGSQRFTTQINAWQQTLKEIGQAEQELLEMQRNKSERDQAVKRQRQRIDRSIGSYQEWSDRAVVDAVAKWTQAEFLSEEFRKEYKSKETAQESAVVYVLEHMRSEIETACKKYIGHLQQDLEGILDSYEMHFVTGKQEAKQLVTPEFDARAAFLSGITGFGAAGIISSIVGGWGVPLIGTGLFGGVGIAHAILVLLGGPVGIAVGLLVGTVSWLVFGTSWQERLAKKLSKEILASGIESKFRSGVRELWTDARSTCFAGLESVELKYRSHMANLRAIVTDRHGGKQMIENRLKEAAVARDFFDGLPWGTC